MVSLGSSLYSLPSALSLRSTLLLLLGGGLHAFSLVWPWSDFQIPWMGAVQGYTLPWLNGLALFILAKELIWGRSSLSLMRAAFAGWAFACGIMLGSCWWLYIALHDYAGFGVVGALVTTVVVATLYAAAYGIAGAIFGYLRRHVMQGISLAVLFALCWTLGDLLRSQGSFGFPWGISGYGQLDGPVAKLAPWIGVYGMSFMAALGAGLLAIAVGRVPTLTWMQRCAFPSFLLALWAVPSMTFTQSTGPLTATLLQGKIPQDEKFMSDKGIPFALRWYRREVLGADTQLVLVPETGIPALPQNLPPSYFDPLVTHLSPLESATKPETSPQSARLLLMGIPLGDKNFGFTNSILGVGNINPLVQKNVILGLPDPWQASYRYDKQHLLPFGEYTPDYFEWFARWLEIPMARFSNSQVRTAPVEFLGQKIAPSICYEDLFSNEVGFQFKDAANAPTVLANFSNMAWFGETLAVDQHLNITRMRSLEFERPTLKVSNTGPTAMINHHGKVQAQLPSFKRGVLVGEVEGRNGNTPYANWLTWGLMGVMASVGGTLLIMLLLARRIFCEPVGVS